MQTEDRKNNHSHKLWESAPENRRQQHFSRATKKLKTSNSQKQTISSHKSTWWHHLYCGGRVLSKTKLVCQPACYLVFLSTVGVQLLLKDKRKATWDVSWEPSSVTKCLKFIIVFAMIKIAHLCQPLHIWTVAMSLTTFKGTGSQDDAGEKT